MCRSAPTLSDPKLGWSHAITLRSGDTKHLVDEGNWPQKEKNVGGRKPRLEKPPVEEAFPSRNRLLFEKLPEDKPPAASDELPASRGFCGTFCQGYVAPCLLSQVVAPGNLALEAELRPGSRCTLLLPCAPGTFLPRGPLLDVSSEGDDGSPLSWLMQGASLPWLIRCSWAQRLSEMRFASPKNPEKYNGSKASQDALLCGSPWEYVPLARQTKSLEAAFNRRVKLNILISKNRGEEC
ncbi:uncharacterized protein [Anas platyrhynchos]|uniref:uncharacterized protein n=1 Tax=Anas platyrhynchos TaxID=8839 RepID=UPI003AF23066